MLDSGPLGRDLSGRPLQYCYSSTTTSTVLLKFVEPCNRLANFSTGRHKQCTTPKIEKCTLQNSASERVRRKFCQAEGSSLLKMASSCLKDIGKVVKEAEEVSVSDDKICFNYKEVD